MIRRTVVFGAACLSLLVAVVMVPGSTAWAKPAGSSAIAPPKMLPGDPTVWLCFPGQADDPCAGSLTTTVVNANGTAKIVQQSPAANPPIDCFYVYPTVSTQSTPNADLTIDPAEKNVALLQASRFSQDCRVYAPMYRQATLSAIFDGDKGVNEVELFGDVLNAWNYYLAHYNDGRGVVLIGHSQGSFVLETLITTAIEKHPDQLDKIVSAVILGGNVNVPVAGATSTTAAGSSGQQPSGIQKTVTSQEAQASGRPGGSFADLPPCRSETQTGCVVAFSSFAQAPPSNSLFGRTSTAGNQILCVNPANPAAPVGKAEPITPYLPVADIGLLKGGTKAGITTPWVSYPDLFTATCEYQGGASWLQINDVRKPGDTRPSLTQALGPTWGLHLIDVNVALGNLVNLVGQESAAWVKHHSTRK